MRAFLPSLILALSGCSEPPPAPSDVPEPAERCALAGDGPAEPRTVEIGELVDGAFHPYQDGDALPLVQGLQGGFMITPSVRISAAEDDPARLCVEVALENDILDGEAPDLAAGVTISLWVEAEGDHLVSGAIDDLLDLDPEPLVGKTLALTCTVDGPVSGSRHVEVMLLSPGS